MIRGYFDPAYKWPVPMVRAALFLPAFTSDWVSVDFLLDTGASVTSLHPIDAVSKVGIDPIRLASPGFLPDTEQHGGIGGELRTIPIRHSMRLGRMMALGANTRARFGSHN